MHYYSVEAYLYIAGGGIRRWWSLIRERERETLRKVTVKSLVEEGKNIKKQNFKVREVGELIKGAAQCRRTENMTGHAFCPSCSIKISSVPLSEIFLFWRMTMIPLIDWSLIWWMDGWIHFILVGPFAIYFRCSERINPSWMNWTSIVI